MACGNVKICRFTHLIGNTGAFNSIQLNISVGTHKDRTLQTFVLLLPIKVGGILSIRPNIFLSWYLPYYMGKPTRESQPNDIQSTTGVCTSK